MFSATRRWFRRNRTPLAIGLGVVGAGYVVTQYVLAKVNDARERMSSDRIAKEKYVYLHVINRFPVTNPPSFSACAADSSRTRKTAHSQSSPYCQPRQQTSWKR
jgi:hypothetical protein